MTRFLSGCFSTRCGSKIVQLIHFAPRMHQRSRAMCPHGQAWAYRTCARAEEAKIDRPGRAPSTSGTTAYYWFSLHRCAFMGHIVLASAPDSNGAGRAVSARGEPARAGWLQPAVLADAGSAVKMKRVAGTIQGARSAPLTLKPTAEMRRRAKRSPPPTTSITDRRGPRC